MAFLNKVADEASCSYTYKRLKTEEPDYMVLKCETDESNQSDDESSIDQAVYLSHSSNVIPMFAQGDHLDIGKLLNKPRHLISDNEKLAILSEQWLIPPNFFFPMREIRGKPRKFSPRWLVEYPWMRYSVSRDAVWCVYCSLFGDKKKFLATDPVRDWANIGTFVKRHISDVSKSHDIAVQKGKFFLSMMKGEEYSQNFEDSAIVNTAIVSTVPQVKVEINSDLVKVILRIIILCVKGDISMSQIPNLINFQAATDPVLAGNMSCSANLPWYFLPEMHQDLVNYCANNILKKIVDACNAAPYFSVLVNTTERKPSENPMYLLCVRFVNSQGHVHLREEFLGFVEETEGMTENDLADLVIKKLQECGIDISRMKGQGHASSFRKSKTFHNRIEMHCPNALYSHLGNENLNFAILQSSTNLHFLHLMSTLKSIVKLFQNNKQKLQNWIGHQNEASESQCRANILMDTNWLEKSDVLSVCVDQYTNIVSALEYLEESRNIEAKNLRTSLVSFDTVLTLIVGHRLLEYLVPLSESLQSITSDLPSVAEEASMLVNLFESKRDDDKLWLSIFGEAVKLGSAHGLLEAVPIPVQVTEGEEAVSSPCQYWKVHLYHLFLDHISTELTERLLRSKDRFLAQYLVPSRLHKLTSDKEISVFDPFASDVLRNTQSYQLTELDRWRHRWANASENPSTFSAAFGAANPDLYPNIATALAVLLAMPVSCQTGEIVMSVVPQVKAYLESEKSIIDQQAGLVLMHVHPDLLTETVCEETVSQFVMDTSRKMAGPLVPLPLQYSGPAQSMRT